MALIEHAGFAPIANRDARILILGSLPGVQSIVRQQYYAHPRNLFWPILAATLSFDAGAPYAQRTAALRRSGIAVWDVCASAHRAGSLDSAIRNHVANDLAGFFASHPRLGQVLFNGQKAAAIYRQVVFDTLGPEAQSLPTSVLPSTSPAHAGMSHEEKLRRWRRALSGIIG